jgi:hypothetical protein
MLIAVLLQPIEFPNAPFFHIINKIDITPRVMMYFQVEVEPYTSLGELESRDPTDETIVSHMQISQFLLGPELSESV